MCFVLSEDGPFVYNDLVIRDAGPISIIGQTIGWMD